MYTFGFQYRNWSKNVKISKLLFGVSNFLGHFSLSKTRGYRIFPRYISRVVEKLFNQRLLFILNST